MKKYTKAERKRIHAALVEAKKYLKTSSEVDEGVVGKSSAICYAMDRAGISQEDNDMACDMIMDRLDPCAMVSTWLTRFAPGARKLEQDLRSFEWQAIVQDYRHRWMDALIKEFSK